MLALALRLCGYGHLASTASRRETDHRDRSREVVERTNTRDDRYVGGVAIVLSRIWPFLRAHTTTGDGIVSSRAIQEQDTIEYWATQAIVSLLRAPSTMYTDQSVFQETGMCSLALSLSRSPFLSSRNDSNALAGPVIIWATDVFERCADEQVIALTRVALKVFISNNIDKQEKVLLQQLVARGSWLVASGSWLVARGGKY